MSRATLRMALLTIAFGLGTYGFGWGTVPVIGLAWGLIGAGTRRVALRAGLAAMLSWILLLLMPALLGAPIVSFGAKLAGAMQVPAWALWLVEVIFPFLIGWSAALLGSAFRSGAPAPDSPPVSQ